VKFCFLNILYINADGVEDRSTITRILNLTTPWTPLVFITMFVEVFRSSTLRILYFSIPLHCIVQWVLQVIFPSACSFIVCWFPLSFTTCFGLHGHLQVCRILHIFKDSASLLFFLRGHTLHVFHLCFVPVLFSFVLFGVFLLVRLSACSLM
jgi:hypothetical protein